MSQTVKTVALYDGSINIAFSPNARNRYMVMEDGHSPVGCTTILQSLAKPGLALWPMYESIAWLKAHPEDYDGAEKAYLIKSDKGKDVGTEVHDAIEKWLINIQNAVTLSRSILADKQAEKAVMAFTNWYVSHGSGNIKVLATEQIIYSKQYDYAGTYDALLEIDGKAVLCDMKTTNTSRTAPLGIYPEYLLQLGGYSLAHHEENPEQQIDDLMIIRVGKDGVLNTLRASELGFIPSFLEDAFKSVVSTYKFLTPLSKVLQERKV